jgi:hypothetical protein
MDLCDADALKSFLDKFGLHVSLKRQHDVDVEALQSNKEKFGTENPVQLLLKQRFLKKTAEKELDGGTEDVYSLGDAQMGDAAECPEHEMQAHLKDLMTI